MSKFFKINLTVWFAYLLGMTNAVCITKGIFDGAGLWISSGLLGIILWGISRNLEVRI